MSKKQTTYECPECGATVTGPPGLEIGCMSWPHPGVGFYMRPTRHTRGRKPPARLSLTAETATGGSA
jgi:hypothetical protein